MPPSAGVVSIREEQCHLGGLDVAQVLDDQGLQVGGREDPSAGREPVLREEVRVGAVFFLVERDEGKARSRHRIALRSVLSRHRVQGDGAVQHDLL